MNSEMLDQAALEKIHAEITKMMAETAKLNRETMLYPVVVTASVMLGIAAVFTVALKFFV